MELMPYFREGEGGIRVKGYHQLIKLEIIQFDMINGGAAFNLGRMQIQSTKWRCSGKSNRDHHSPNND
jgi:hypothetical protein